MAGLKSLAKDTAIYGVSSIVGRFLNYLLVPIYAAAMSAASGGYGVVTEVYAWTALLMVILTYGMETTFFRFVNKETENPGRVYPTVPCGKFLFAVCCFVHDISSSYCRYDGICRPSLVYRYDGIGYCDGCVSVYSVCLFTL